MAVIEPLILETLDGADAEGGTVYVLRDGGEIIDSSPWPMPLMQLAEDLGRAVRRMRYRGWEEERDDW